MVRRIVLPGLALAALAACGGAGSSSSGPAVARGDGLVITAGEFKARLAEQSPFIRARFSSLERRKEFLDNLIRFEVLAHEAAREGLEKDPDVQLTLQKVMVQKLVQKVFATPTDGPAVPDSEVRGYYDGHKDEFFRPRRLRLSLIVWSAPASGPVRAAKLALARKALAKVKATERKDPGAFAAAAKASTEDAAGRQTGGDLGFRSQDELAASYGAELAAAVFALPPGATSGVIETPKGIYLAKATGVMEQFDRPFDTVKGQIAQKLLRERKTKEFDALVKRLRDQAHVEIDEKALAAIQVDTAAAEAEAAGMGGMGGGRAMGPHFPGPAAGPSAGVRVTPTPAAR